MGASVSVGGSYEGAEASLEVNVDTFKASMSDETKFGEDKVVFTVGGDDLPEPIAIQLVPLHEALKSVYYTADVIKKLSAGCDFSDSVLKSKLAHVKTALVEYPKKMGAFNPTGEETCPLFALSLNDSH